MGECIDFNVSFGQLENFGGFQLMECFKKCVRMVEARGTKFPHKVIQIVVGWAQAAQIKKKVGLKNCHVALMVLAWLMHAYEGGVASPIGVLARFFGWAKDFKWESFNVSLEGIVLRDTATDYNSVMLTTSIGCHNVGSNVGSTVGSNVGSNQRYIVVHHR